MSREDAGQKFLLGIDLEDVRLGVENGMSYEPRVGRNTHLFLDWLSMRGFKCTFFVVGETALLYKQLIKEIISEGHEIGCHTMHHRVLDSYDPEDLRKDLIQNIDTLKELGANELKGFRAPSYSLTPATAWVYEMLGSLGFLYSSSVLPAANPLSSGWPDFGQQSKIMDGNILEIPLTTGRIGPFRVPLAGGVYFRALPILIIRWFLKNRVNEVNPLTGYIHPFDIDTEQERFMQGGINGNRIYNALMYYNRDSVFCKLNFLVDQGYEIITYKEYAETVFAGLRDELQN